MQLRYLLIDYENVQPKCLEGLDTSMWRVMVFVGTNQSKVPFALAAALQALGSAAEYLQVCGSGRNALDFHIAYTMGRLAASNPKSCFYILSKDTGFDPLLTHMRNEGFAAYRCTDLKEVSSLEGREADGSADRFLNVVRNLQSRGSSRPRKRKTLISTIQALHQKSLSQEEVEAIIDALLQKGYIGLDGDAVRYRLPEL